MATSGSRGRAIARGKGGNWDDLDKQMLVMKAHSKMFSGVGGLLPELKQGVWIFFLHWWYFSAGIIASA